ncbi:MAG: RNA methyltransferase [Deltaproteobacteria bacterium]|nr:RNA methyltransferase [Deltaproteobacteria bacterium]
MREATYLALVHHPTVDREGRILATAVTTLDLHDFARLARTYGLGGVYATTPLEGQRALAARLMDHWVRGYGGEMNPCRREALAGLSLCASLADAVRELTERWGNEALLIGTSARPGAGRVTFREAKERLSAWRGPALLVFGTGWGLAPEVLEACASVLEPIGGYGPYNHLSVRSAASIAVDRLFG